MKTRQLHIYLCTEIIVNRVNNKFIGQEIYTKITSKRKTKLKRERPYKHIV